MFDKDGNPHFRFHSLCHYWASIQHVMGIPDAYCMQRRGWGNDGILKQIYRHVTEIKENAMNQKANDYFSSLCNTNTEKPWFKLFYNCGQQDLNLHVGDTRT